MGKCYKCIKHDICGKREVFGSLGCTDDFQQKRMTNADKIRKMSDEELAFLIFNINDVCGKASMHQHKRILSDLIEDYDLSNIKGWLQQEVPHE